MRFDIPGVEFPVLATTMFAEIISALPKRERKTLALPIFKGIITGHDRWATGTIKEGPSLTELLEREDLSAILRELFGKEGTEMLAKVTELFA